MRLVNYANKLLIIQNMVKFYLRRLNMFNKKTLMNKILSILFNILWIALGIFAIASPKGFGASLGLVAGTFMIIIGSLILLFALFSSTLIIGSGFLFLEGIITLCIGILLVVFKEASLSIVTFSLAFYFLFNGLSKVINSIDIKKFKVKSWWVTLLIGLLYIVLSIVLFAFNDGANNVVSILIGIFFILTGVFGILELFDVFKREKRESTIIKNIHNNVDNLDHIDIDFTKDDKDR